MLRPLMRSVSGTERKPVRVLSATAQSTEWIMTKTSEGLPRPNQIRASGSSAIAGSGLNIAVSIDSRSEPARVETATVVRTAASARPDAYPIASTCSEVNIRSGNTPVEMSRHKVWRVSVRVGKSSGLLIHRA